MSKNTRTRILLVAVAALLLVTLTVGGTIAYLQATSTEVTNTFTPTDIDVDLAETVPTGKTAQLVPGVDISKDPKVTASSTVDVAYWVFVDVNESDWIAAEHVEYSINTSVWTLLGTNDKGATVYYHAVNAGGDFEAYVLAGNDQYPNGVVTVSEELEKEDMQDENGTALDAATLTFKAYAIQQASFTGDDAIETAYETVSGNTIN